MKTYNLKPHTWKKGKKLASYDQLRREKKILVMIRKHVSFTEKSEYYFYKIWFSHYGGGTGKSHPTKLLTDPGIYSLPEEQWEDFIKDFSL